ncbi:PE-PPE domain-containing protein [Nocardia transvalensis]|uniref:PE-PPE domain-containing protein n=1 Tax=Nocardia transvalensis TaxID=37333 RepID=UPI0018942738|nr:PE-PPE domain-containing protein [Nocardia transvalensis]MBF6326938.1 PE-PPE domain-containing protein [Nocardia transvalensis]
MAQHKLFCIPGTWEAVAAAERHGGIDPGTEIGMLTGVTDLLDRAVFDVVYVNYPASFGPVPCGGASLLNALGRPSYRQSRDMGVAEVVRLIRAHRGSFGILGYSQGGAVASLVGRKLVSGELRDRLPDCRWLHTFASPHRTPGHTFPLGNQLVGQGISGDSVSGFGSIDWFDYCLPGDIYGDADLRDTYLHLGHDLAIELSLVDPYTMISRIADSLLFGRLRDAILELGEDPLQMVRKVAITTATLVTFLQTFPHDKYGVREIVPGLTALRHSANHLNFWGPRTILCEDAHPPVAALMCR